MFNHLQSNHTSSLYLRREFSPENASKKNPIGAMKSSANKESSGLGAKVWKIIRDAVDWVIVKIVQLVRSIFGTGQKFIENLTIQAADLDQRIDLVFFRLKSSSYRPPKHRLWKNLSLDDEKIPRVDSRRRSEIAVLMDLQLLHFEVKQMKSMIEDLLTVGYKELKGISRQMSDVDRKLQQKMFECSPNMIIFIDRLTKSLKKENLQKLEIGFLRPCLSLLQFIKTEFSVAKPFSMDLAHFAFPSPAIDGSEINTLIKRVQDCILTKQVSRSERTQKPASLRSQLLGIHNIGNSCYLNSCLQAVLWSSLSKYFPSGATASFCGKDKTLQEALYEFRQAYLFQKRKKDHSKYEKARMVALLYQVRKALFDFGGGMCSGELLRQQDAGECMSALLKALKYEISIKTTTTAMDADEPIRAETKESAQIINVEIPDGPVKTFEENFIQWGREEVRDPENAWKHNGAVLTHYAREFTFTKTIPDTLVVCMKRFRYDRNKKKLRKLDTPIRWQSDEIDIRNLIDPALLGPETSTRYALEAYINHHGKTINWGHYTAKVKADGKNWYCMDDKLVTKLGSEEKKAREQGYLFVFRRV